MSVLIKGMEMPTSCGDCKLRMAVGCYGNLPHNTRMPNCRLVPVPDHGRLVDADALKDTDNFIHKTMLFGGQVVYAQDAIDRAPTIIPADKEGAE